MSKAAKRGKSAQGGAAGAKWEQGLLAAQFEEVSFFQWTIKWLMFFNVNKCTLVKKIQILTVKWRKKMVASQILM